MNEKLLREWIYEALVEEVPLKNMADYIYKQHTYMPRNSEIQKIVSELKADPERERELALEIFGKRFDLAKLNQMIFLCQKGMRFIEVAANLRCTEAVVQQYIYQLSLKKSVVSNPLLYRKIMNQEKALNQKPILEIFKDYARIEEEYACRVQDLSNSFLIKRYLDDKNYRELVSLYIATDFSLSDQALAQKFSMAVSTVQRLLNNEEDLSKYTTKEQAQAIHQYRIDRHKAIRFEFSNRGKTGSTEDKKIQSVLRNIGFWLQIILNFRLSLEDFAKIIGYTDLEKLRDALYVELEHRSPIQKKAAEYTFTMYPNENPLHYKAATRFLNMYYLLKKQGHEAEATAQYKKLCQVDMDFSALVKQGMRTPMTDDERITILKYKVKYAVIWLLLPVRKKDVLDFKEPMPKELADELELNDHFHNQKVTRGS